MMKHEIFEDLLLQSMTHSISAHDQSALKAHLATCAECRASLAEWQQIAASVRLHAQEREMMHAPNYAQPLQQVRNRRPTALLIAGASILCMALIGFFYRPTSSPSLVAQIATPTSTPVAYVEMVLAARDIENGSVIQADDVTLFRMPIDYAPFTGIVLVDDVVGKIARTNILCGLPVLTNMLVENARDVLVQQEIHEPSVCDLAPLSEPVETEDIVIAVQEIPPGVPISEDAVALRPYPVQLIPNGVVRSLEEVIGKQAVRPFFREEPLLGAQVQELPALVEVTIPASQIQNAESLLVSGNRVDVIVTMLFVDIDDVFQEPLVSFTVPASSQVEGQAITQRIMSDTQVISVQTDSDGKVESVTLEVSPSDETVLIWMIEANLPFMLARVSSSPPG